MTDARGSQLYEKRFDSQIGHTRMDFDLGAVGRGLYVIEVRDTSGRRLALDRFMVRP